MVAGINGPEPINFENESTKSSTKRTGGVNLEKIKKEYYKGNLF